jgi:hypothetical protein
VPLQNRMKTRRQEVSSYRSLMIPILYFSPVPKE